MTEAMSIKNAERNFARRAAQIRSNWRAYCPDRCDSYHVSATGMSQARITSIHSQDYP
jgi:hypothetical protein